VTLFDIDYVLAKTSMIPSSSSKEEEDEEVIYAMLDQCPHKKVALSEGRITDCGTSDKRYIQCSYQGMYCDIEYVWGYVVHSFVLFLLALYLYTSSIYLIFTATALNNRMDV